MQNRRQNKNAVRVRWTLWLSAERIEERPLRRTSWPASSIRWSIPKAIAHWPSLYAPLHALWGAGQLFLPSHLISTPLIRLPFSSAPSTRQRFQGGSGWAMRISLMYCARSQFSSFYGIFRKTWEADWLHRQLVGNEISFWANNTRMPSFTNQFSNQKRLFNNLEASNMRNCDGQGRWAAMADTCWSM